MPTLEAWIADQVWPVEEVALLLKVENYRLGAVVFPQPFT
jgi:hypothetical protein